MKQTSNTRRLGAVAATLGMALALGGTSYAVAQGGDIGSRGASVAAEPAGISPVIGKSWASWVAAEFDPLLPATAPQYSQVNFLTASAATGGPIKTAQGAGQMHAEATVEVHKEGPGSANVYCDMRITGSSGSNVYAVSIPSDGTSVTIPLVGHKAGLAAGDHNAGVRCWAQGAPVRMYTVGLHAVVYGASVPS